MRLLRWRTVRAGVVDLASSSTSNVRRTWLTTVSGTSACARKNLPAAELQDLMKGLEESLTYVDHLLRRTSSVKPAEP